jgi:hypothetical protein
MSLKPLLCTVTDIRNLSEYISTEVRDDARVRQYIIRADSMIRDMLRPIYTIEAGILESAPWNGPVQIPFALPDDGISANTGTGELIDITTVSTADLTQVYTLTFSDTTNFTCTSDLEGAQGAGTTGGDFTSTNGDIIVPTANWIGTPAANDVFKVAVYLPKPTIVTCSALLSAGLMLRSVMTSGQSDLGDIFWSNAQQMLTRLQKPYDDDGIQLDSFSPRDISPEGVNYAVDRTGNDVSKYTDNENTPWVDSNEGGVGFYYGPIWSR